MITKTKINKKILKKSKKIEGEGGNNMDIKDVKFDENGLIPAIVQDKDSGEVLMLAYMNENALNKTMETNETWFYSRSRQELWHKGATSGNTQQVENIQL